MIDECPYISVLKVAIFAMKGEMGDNVILKISQIMIGYTLFFFCLFFNHRFFGFISIWKPNQTETVFDWFSNQNNLGLP